MGGRTLRALVVYRVREGSSTGSANGGSSQAGPDNCVRAEAIRTGVSCAPPSIWEIGAAVGLNSTSSVAHPLLALERK
ncbi:hypothetical protein OG462_44345 [Streptomyces sp. NBC_01077]|uniref:LexA family protein n=1 Tax=Streptomyces sp. NBC_01077 TaxID=2903746 RepID=UPI00386FC59D|nr:hypothetical protein OG462_00655 [Streptomyces sp. NBC_01077]WSV44363.1 hypothetical protein OG462_44345 [Streptomyces sp. NBC_01077]